MSESRHHEAAAASERTSWHVPRLIVAWLVALTGSLCAVLLFPAEDRSSWLVLALGLTTLVTFALQLGTGQREGFISRVSFSVAGGLVIALGTAGIALLV